MSYDPVDKNSSPNLLSFSHAPELPRHFNFFFLAKKEKYLIGLLLKILSVAAYHSVVSKNYLKR